MTHQPNTASAAGVSDNVDTKTLMREGFEQQRKVGMNVDWFTWQIAWHDALFSVHDLVPEAAASAKATVREAPDMEVALKAMLGEKYCPPTRKPNYDWLSPTSADRADLEADDAATAPSPAAREADAAVEAVDERAHKQYSTQVEWPEGYCLDPNGAMCCPTGKHKDWAFGYDLGYADALALRAALSTPSPQSEAGDGVTLTDEQRQGIKSAIAGLRTLGWTHSIPSLESLLREAGSR